jgi:segregation and condensation protein B
MQKGRNTIPIGEGTQDWKNRFPGAVAFVETLDTEEDVSEPTDILSFESLREAFATIQSAEAELVQTIPEIALSVEQEPESPERPDYDIEDGIDLEDENSLPPLNTEPLIAVGTCLETIIEAMLFTGNRENRPISADQIAEKLRNVSVEEVDQAVIHMNEHYRVRNCPYTILFERSTAEHAGYRMVLRSEFESVRSHFYGKIREPRLSQQAIDTLAVVAYRQPITAEEVQNIRQQSCSAVLTQLVRRDLLRISREVQNKKGIVRYHTTPRFLELCQIKSLDDIPRVNEWD